jgi:mRNA interferase YafQ
LLAIEETGSFRRDVKRIQKQGKDISKLFDIVLRLASGQPLEAKHKPHPLKGEWVPSWECHIEPDWLLIYQVEATRLLLVRTGSHSNLFR